MSYAREEIQRCSGTQFDPKVVEVFLTMPGTLWNELRENIGRPYRLSQLRAG
jgi:response regulator RpfG family c-di-GMP phosphodiesterase